MEPGDTCQWLLWRSWYAKWHTKATYSCCIVPQSTGTKLSTARFEAKLFVALVNDASSLLLIVHVPWQAVMLSCDYKCVMLSCDYKCVPPLKELEMATLLLHCSAIHWHEAVDSAFRSQALFVALVNDASARNALHRRSSNTCFTSCVTRAFVCVSDCQLVCCLGKRNGRNGSCIHCVGRFARAFRFRFLRLSAYLEINLCFGCFAISCLFVCLLRKLIFKLPRSLAPQGSWLPRALSLPKGTSQL